MCTVISAIPLLYVPESHQHLTRSAWCSILIADERRQVGRRLLYVQYVIRFVGMRRIRQKGRSDGCAAAGVAECPVRTSPGRDGVSLVAVGTIFRQLARGSALPLGGESESLRLGVSRDALPRAALPDRSESSSESSAHSYSDRKTMKFKPCIDLHAGQVKQIVGSTLTENDSSLPIENFVSSLSAEEYAR